MIAKLSPSIATPRTVTFPYIHTRPSEIKSMNHLPVPTASADVQDNSVLHQTEAFRDALEAARGFALAEKSDATRKAYASDWRRFREWCDKQGTDVLPASIATTAAYLASLAAERKRVSTI